MIDASDARAPAGSKIAIYGFGSAPPVFRHVIAMARAQCPALAWCMILPQPNHRAIVREVLPEAEILDVFRELPRVPTLADPAELAGYVGSFCEDLAAQKRQWRKLSGRWLFDRGADIYRLYKGFLASRGATHLLALNVESPDAKIAIAAARELGLGVMMATDLRSLTGTMFASDAVETPPRYARPGPETRAAAEHLVAEFRQSWLPARAQPRDIDAADDDTTRLDSFTPRFAERLAGFVRHAGERPDLFDPVYVRDAVMNSSRLMQRAIWGTRARLNTGKHHVADVADLPRRFVFYPLQYTPESSINTPAPYFVDQLRVIDALRFAMPSDCTLVVKEHWSCLPLRPVGFVPALMRLPGVCVVDHKMPARQLIERAGVTVSVTGTAVLEAVLAERPAIALGPGISSWTLGGPTPLGTLPEVIRQRFGRPQPHAECIDRVATLLDARYPFYHASVNMPGEPMLRRGNLERLLAAITTHLERDAAPRVGAERSAAAGLGTSSLDAAGVGAAET